MKTKRSLLSALVLTCAILSGRAAEKTAAPVTIVAPKPQIEVCFVLDTTGSMGGLIEGAKQKIWSIANEIIAAKPTPSVKFALIGYRDRGDDYVTKVTALTDDLDAVYGELRKFTANGGGDTPEAVSEALDDAVNKITWSTDRSVLKIIYLVGDAPPHTDYKDGADYRAVCTEAAKRDLIINTVQCGNLDGTREFWTDIARRSEGQYVALAQTGNMIAVSTPFDQPLAALNIAVGKTLIPYGSAATRAEVRAKQHVAEAAAPAAAADRLRFNSMSGGKIVQGSGELLDALREGKVTLSSLNRDELPEELKTLDEAALKKRLDDTTTERAALQKQINELGKKREDFLAAEQRRLAATGKGDSFDTKVAEILREQAKRKGIAY